MGAPATQACSARLRVTRAVLDANVLISGFLWAHGVPGILLTAWREGRFELVASELLLAEVEEALGAPKLRGRVRPEERDELIRHVRAHGTVYHDPAAPPPVSPSDPDDTYLVALAAACRAPIVSGDRHLLALAGRIPVYSPREFLEFLEAHP